MRASERRAIERCVCEVWYVYAGWPVGARRRRPGAGRLEAASSQRAFTRMSCGPQSCSSSCNSLVQVRAFISSCIHKRHPTLQALQLLGTRILSWNRLTRLTLEPSKGTACAARVCSGQWAGTATRLLRQTGGHCHASIAGNATCLLCHVAKFWPAALFIAVVSFPQSPPGHARPLARSCRMKKTDVMSSTPGPTCPTQR